MIVTAVPPDAAPVLGDKLETAGAFEAVDLNATACIIQSPGFTGALAI